MITRSIFSVPDEKISFLLFANDSHSDPEWNWITSYISERNLELSNKLCSKRNLIFNYKGKEFANLNAYLQTYLYQLLDERPPLSRIQQKWEEPYSILDREIILSPRSEYDSFIRKISDFIVLMRYVQKNQFNIYINYIDRDDMPFFPEILPSS